ncbi:DNA-directed RNA polymerase subunit omega [Candidatus Williamhamiltonella defendens]|uniref:DNA-directed RNA polymerase subunit omega n=1 Tax=Candidatus Williamhamiltonella defendens TaxID=138072 RepID=A0A2D3TFQ8_9ENTR|nr:DNA-directed RNA polymerase subunit omega [Candidatus Hamiltonella defensa]ATW34652.1 DNA-directed RNA polymerase subunit omega [Candidatus Hamiltonella defensa]
MARVTVQAAVEKVGNRFKLILVAVHRARLLQLGRENSLVPEENDKVTVIALREIEQGLITESILKENNQHEDQIQKKVQMKTISSTQDFD